MDAEIYADLPDDPELAFVQLESHFRKQMEIDIAESDDGGTIAYYKSRYINQTIAAARALDIEGIRDYSLPDSESNVWSYFETFSSDANNITIQIKIRSARRTKQYSVRLSSSDKRKIHHYIEQIRDTVENSNCGIEKREAIYKKLADLTLAVDRDRTKLEAIADSIRVVARLSGDVEKDGAEPWWKWVKLIFNVVDDAKEKEGSSTLPPMDERRKLEAPRKEPPPTAKPRNLDDEIPF